MRRYINLYKAIFVNNLERELEFRLDFFLENLTTLIWFGANIIMLEILYLHSDSVAGWKNHELLVLLGIFLLIRNIFGLFFESNLSKLSDYVRLGTFDFFIVKPVNLQFLFSTRFLNFRALSQLLLAPILIVVGLKQGNITPTPLQMVVFPTLLLSGLSVVYALWLMIVTLSFYFIGTQNFSLLFEIILDTTRYPIDVYRSFLKFFLTYLIPLILIATLPTRLLVRTFEPNILLAEIIGAFLSFFISCKFFAMSVKRYTSTSS